MPSADGLSISRSVPVERTPRVVQLEGMFDLPPTKESSLRWDVQLNLPDAWNIGLIFGPSGCGKTTLAQHLWPEKLTAKWDWPAERSIVDGFPAGMGIKDITGLLCSVGFSSPPSWLRPFGCLSNGEQFRVLIARTLAEQPDLAVVDEFTSVVDRDVAKIASAAVAKTVRKRGQQLVAVSCHFDIAEWLEPDWIYQPHTGEFSSGRLLRRPQLEVTIRRVHSSAWQLFKQHHYLSSNLHRAAACFLAEVWGRPAAFCAVLHWPHPSRPGWREHRTVCLPDFQGVGLGNALSEYVASLFRATGKPYRGITSHPAFIRHRLRSSAWKCVRAPSLMRLSSRSILQSLVASLATRRLTAGFEYIGPARPEEARGFGLSVPGPR